MPTEIASFSEIEAEFIARVHAVVWCNVATVDGQSRPRSRILHTLWEGSTGWTATVRHPLMAKHLARNPHVSLAYVANVVKPVYVDCVASWDDDPADKRRIWEAFRTAPPPLGYDPAPIFQGVDHPDFVLLQFTPWRIELADVSVVPTKLVWRRRSNAT